MKLSARTLSSMLLLCLVGMVVGTLAWEVVERILGRVGVALDLSIGPVGFDLAVVAVQLRANPGSFIGLAAAALLARSL
jgi:hypothetical protein